MSFAAIEARATAGVFRRLANAQATYTPPVGPAVTFAVVFDAAMGVVDEFGAQTVQPTLLMQPSACPQLATDAALQIAGVSYRVRTLTPQAEGGMQRAMLARVS